MVSNYSNILVTFNKGENIGHLENINGEENSQPHEHSDAYTMNSVRTQKMMSEQVELDAVEPPHHKPEQNIETKLQALLKEYKS